MGWKPVEPDYYWSKIYGGYYRVTELLEAHLMKQSELQEVEIQKALRDACILRFEYCIELSWKTSMKVLGSKTLAAKPAVREMARNDLVTEANLWFEFIESRNETSHAYDEEVVVKVFQTLQNFIPEAEKLIRALESLK